MAARKLSARAQRRILNKALHHGVLGPADAVAAMQVLQAPVPTCDAWVIVSNRGCAAEPGPDGRCDKHPRTPGRTWEPDAERCLRCGHALDGRRYCGPCRMTQHTPTARKTPYELLTAAGIEVTQSARCTCPKCGKTARVSKLGLHCACWPHKTPPHYTVLALERMLRQPEHGVGHLTNPFDPPT